MVTWTPRGIAASDVDPIVIDIETVGHPSAPDWLEPVTAAKNLRDPEKVKADIEQRTAERNEKLALDWNTGRIIALAYWTETSGDRCWLCKNEADEAAALKSFWEASRNRLIVGFYCKNFDLPFMIQRSRLLEIPHPHLDLGRYSQRGVIDLFHELTFNDAPATSCMRRSLHAFARRFGIPVADEVAGADIPALYAAGNWDAITGHVLSDVALTVALARRLGILQTQEQVA